MDTAKTKPQRSAFLVKSTRFFLLLLVPIVCVFYFEIVRHKNGSVVVARDASYYYLLASADVSYGKTTNYAYHPGVPLYLFGGAVLKLNRLFLSTSDEEWIKKLILEPEKFLEFLGLILVIINIICLILFGLFVHNSVSSIVFVWLLQVFLITIPHTYYYIGLYQPESIWIVISVMLSIACVGNSRFQWLYLPFTAATAIALKLNYLPILLWALFQTSLRKITQSISLTLLAFTTYCLVFYPSWKRYITYFSKAILTKDAYAKGEAGFLSFDEVILKVIEGGNKGLMILIAFITFLFFVSIYSGVTKSKVARKYFVLNIIFFGLILVYFRKPTHGYYVIPAYALVPTILILQYKLVRHLKIRWLVLVTFLLFVSHQCVEIFEIVPRHTNWIQSNTEEVSRLQGFLNRKSECELLVSSPVPTNLDGLFMAANEEWRGRLSALYPKASFYTIDDDIFVWSFFWRENERSWLARRGKKCILFLFNGVNELSMSNKVKFLKKSKLVFESRSSKVLEYVSD